METTNYAFMLVGMLFVLFFCGMCILECLDRGKIKAALLWTVPVLTELIYIVCLIKWGNL